MKMNRIRHLKHAALLMALAGTMSLTQAVQAGSRMPDVVFVAEGGVRIAQFSAEERDQLRQRWLDLRPEEREALRQQMLEKQRRLRDRASEMPMEPSRFMPGFGFGQGFEQRRDDRHDDRYEDRYDDRDDDRRGDRDDDSRRRGRR